MEIDTVIVGVWVSRYALRDGTNRGHEHQRLTTAGLCTRCECCIELRDYDTRTAR
ncbi:MAG TPA: hypothetical protein VH439_03915 [Gemmatimonadales bacterium]|jgi:hypothetical protein